ncbi:MAG: hypothetical protein GY719_01850 [bacterium]|nr:hypothetical protein [bacterium]
MFSYLAVVMLGALIGIGEVISRYRDAPSRALATVPGVFYVGLNGGSAAIALLLLQESGMKFGLEENSTSLPWVQVIVAGLAAMAVLRSSFFSLHSGDKEIGIGPSALLELLLDAADRAVDRTRAEGRAEEVARLTRELSYERSRKALPLYCLELMQNLPPDDQKSLAEELATLDGAEIEDEVKILMLGLTLINRVGPGVLRAAIKSLGQRIASSRPDRPLETEDPGSPVSA